MGRLCSGMGSPRSPTDDCLLRRVQLAVAMDVAEGESASACHLLRVSAAVRIVPAWQYRHSVWTIVHHSPHAPLAEVAVAAGSSGQQAASGFR